MIAAGSGRIAGAAIGCHPVPKRIRLTPELAGGRLFVRELRLAFHGTWIYSGDSMAQEPSLRQTVASVVQAPSSPACIYGSGPTPGVIPVSALTPPYKN